MDISRCTIIQKSLNLPAKTFSFIRFFSLLCGLHYTNSKSFLKPALSSSFVNFQLFFLSGAVQSVQESGFVLPGVTWSLENESIFTFCWIIESLMCHPLKAGLVTVATKQVVFRSDKHHWNTTSFFFLASCWKKSLSPSASHYCICVSPTPEKTRLKNSLCKGQSFVLNAWFTGEVLEKLKKKDSGMFMWNNHERNYMEMIGGKNEIL